MNRDFHILHGMTLKQSDREIDLHNDFDFLGFDYSAGRHVLSLRWQRSSGEWVPPSTPLRLVIEFHQISLFDLETSRSHSVNSGDDCVHCIGYRHPSPAPDDVIVLEPGQVPDPAWLTAIQFASGTIMTLQAASARAIIDEEAKIAR
jgi:hypothetical protein